MWRSIPLQKGFVEFFLGDSCAFLLFWVVLFFFGGGGLFRERGKSCFKGSYLY